MPKTINLAPTWETTAEMLLRIIESGETETARKWARSEVRRMGRIIDHYQGESDAISE